MDLPLITGLGADSRLTKLERYESLFVLETGQKWASGAFDVGSKIFCDRAFRQRCYSVIDSPAIIIRCPDGTHTVLLGSDHVVAQTF